MRSIRIAKVLALLAVVSAASSARAADERVSMFGYFRVSEGSQLTSGKGRQTYIGLSGPISGSHKFRLGNEQDWAEFGWNLLAFKGEDGTVGHAVMMLGGNYNVDAMGSGDMKFSGWEGGHSEWGTSSFIPNLQQLYVDLAKIPGIDATFWLGRKYYKREYSGVNDFFYWSHQGFGAGIEDINLGAAKLSYAILAAGQSESNHGYVHDLRLTSIPVMPGGRIAVGGEVTQRVSDHHLNSDFDIGYAAGVQYIQDMMGGSNQLALQYGVGALGANDSFGVNGGINLQATSKRKKARILDNININPTKELNLEVVGIFQKDQTGATHQSWFQIGGRATYAIGQHVQALLEVGYDTIKSRGADESLWLLKVTPAIELCAAPGNVPRIRAYATYNTWSDSAKGAVQAGAAGVGVRADSTNVLSVGLQGEAWF